MSVDCVDCYIKQTGLTFSSHKLKKKSALRYGVAVAIGLGEIVWVNGPFQPGEFPDIECLQTALDDNKRVEAMMMDTVETQQSASAADVLTRDSEEADALQKSVQGWHETVNAQLKTFDRSWSSSFATMKHNMAGCSPLLLALFRLR